MLNRAAKRATIFETDADYLAFEHLLREAADRRSVAIFAYCLMPNHWHLIVSPRADGALSRFMHWLTTTHARRWQVARGLDGEGAVYQGRFKAIPIGGERHFLWVCRYVERNALRAGLVTRAEAWRWSSLGCRIGADGIHGCRQGAQNNAQPQSGVRYDPPVRNDRGRCDVDVRHAALHTETGARWLADWPCPPPDGWIALVNRPQTVDEMIAFRTAVAQGKPFGKEEWVTHILQRLGQSRPPRPRGRPRKSVLFK